MEKIFFDFLNTKEVRCLYCDETVNLDNFGYNVCDVCDTENKFTKFYVVFKNDSRYNLYDYCIEHGLFEVETLKELKKIIKVMDYEIADRIKSRCSNDYLKEKYGVKLTCEGDYEITDKEKAKNKIILSHWDDFSGINCKWQLLGNVLECYDEYKKLLEDNWNKHCDNIMLGQLWYKENDTSYIENYLYELGLSNIRGYVVKLTPIEKIYEHRCGYDMIYECELILREEVIYY